MLTALSKHPKQTWQSFALILVEVPNPEAP
jgi:hypothetical protein